MKTKFSLIRFFDPMGDGKSSRKQHSRKNYKCDLPMNEVEAAINRHNSKGSYYGEIRISSVDARSTIFNQFNPLYF